MDYLTADFWRDHTSVGATELTKRYPETSLSGWQHRRAAAQKAFPDLSWPAKCQGRAPSVPTDVTPIDEQVEAELEAQRIADELKTTRAKYRHVVRRENVYRQLAKEGADALAPVSPVCPPPKVRKESGTIRQAFVLNWADWHVEHQFTAEMMEGLNFYDPPTVVRRVAACVDKTLLMAQLSERIVYPVLYVHDFGDNCQNFLHEDDAPTNSMPPMKAARFAAELKAIALRDLAAHFPAVVFRGVPGNHGRMTRKMASGLPTENLDWLVYQWTRALCAELPNVTFEIPDNWSLTADVEGWGFFLNHGTFDAKGGFGGISWYSQMKSDTKRTAIDVKLGRHVLVRQYGHLHTEADTPRAAGNGRIRVEPSLVGGDPYALNNLGGTFSEPSQSLIAVHAEEGFVCDYPLNVRIYDTAPECRYDPLLDLV